MQPGAPVARKAGEATDMWLLDSRGQAVTCVVRDVHVVKTMTGVSVTGEPTFIDSYVYSVACPHGQPYEGARRH